VTINDFTVWAQAKMDSCNVHDEIEASKVIVEIMQKLLAFG